MDQEDYSGVLPDQYTGKEIRAGAETSFEDRDGAIAFYRRARTRLLTINNWHKTAGILSAVFRACDRNGNETEMQASENYFIRIDIPGPGSAAGHGYDWVKIEKVSELTFVEHDVETIGIRVRPSSNPATGSAEIAHFYSEEATGNFILTRKGTKVIVLICDRNAKPNADPATITDKIRDSAVGAGAIAIFSKMQWQHLADGILRVS